jgi:hypothetical protein
MPYEAGMLVMFDVVSKSIFVEFRGMFTTLPGPFADRVTGIRAGEAYCLAMGWKPDSFHPKSSDGTAPDDPND